MIYLDHAATTKPILEVKEAMEPWLFEEFGNPSAIYGPGARAKKLINQTRRLIAESLEAKENEIFFTSGGTESDNWALRAVAEGYASRGRHIVTSAVEHHAILHTCAYLEKRGFRVTYVPVDAYGMVDPKEIEKAICTDTILISIMYANNEVGTIQPIREIGKIAREHNVLFHTDAVQAYGHLPISVETDMIDLLSVSAHKLYGPKGIGFLYKRDTVKLSPLLFGGGQERGMRAGTENVAAIAGFQKAVEHMMKTGAPQRERLELLRDETIRWLQENVPDCHLNGHPVMRLPGNIHMSFPGLEGESLLIQLDMKGICASSGSACTSGSLEPSHVLVAMGLDDADSKGSLRLTLGEENTEEDVMTACEVIRDTVHHLRSMTGYR